MVKIMPPASDSPAEPMVCTTLFSNIESRLSTPRRMAMEMTAAGMDAEMVMPTRSPRYALAPPKTMASATPHSIEKGVSSFMK